MTIQSIVTIESLFDDPDGTREEIMKATYEALCTHGYADLTIQRIGDEFPKSKSLLYHHYDSKDALLLDFLAYMLEHFETGVPREDHPDAAAHLRAVFDHVLPDELDEGRREFTSAMVELQAQAAHDPEYREHFTRSTRFFHDRFVTIIENGIEQGVFRDVDPDRVATLLMATIDGARFQRVTTEGDDDIAAVRDELQAYVETRLHVDGESEDDE